jgi:signal transduction histidine kinase
VLWFGTHKGLSRLIPVPDAPRRPPPVMINGLRIAGVPYAVSELGQTVVQGLELAASQNQIQIDFLGIDFTPSEALRYQYKLEGADADWSAPTEQRTVNYANLSPGNYRFLVRAVNASNVNSETPAGVAFRILPPIYRRWWFLTLCALAVGLTILSIDRYRVARMRELNAALSESKQLAENLREQGTQLHQVNKTLELQNTITDILAESRSLKEAAPHILQAICRSVGWEMGALWQMDAQANVLRCVDVWDAPGGFDGSEFERMSREYTFAPGVGLPGRVWASGQPLWINAIATDDDFLRLTIDTEGGGIQSAFGFPILLGGEVYGIIEFFSLETHEPDKELLETMSTIGSQIGQLIERRRAEEALRLAREERLAELERVRKRIATDLHDDIGSSLTQISILSEVARQQVGHNNSPIAKPLKMIATASRELVDSMSDIVWAINPQKDHLSDLQQRMRRFASDVFTARNIDFRFRSPDHETDIQLGANLRREVFLIFKESINNMVKHSGCDRADIEFDVKEDQLYLRLTDNGHGFDGTRESDGHGLMSMRERAKALGAELEIISHVDSGTTIMLQVPLGRGLPQSASPR